MLLSHPTRVLPTSFSSSPEVGNPLCAPRESQKQWNTALVLLGWSCSTGWLRQLFQLCWARRAWDSLAGGRHDAGKHVYSYVLTPQGFFESPTTAVAFSPVPAALLPCPVSAPRRPAWQDSAESAVFLLKVESTRHRKKNLTELEAKPFVLSQRVALRSAQARHTVSVSSEVKN